MRRTGAPLRATAFAAFTSVLVALPAPASALTDEPASSSGAHPSSPAPRPRAADADLDALREEVEREELRQQLRERRASVEARALREKVERDELAQSIREREGDLQRRDRDLETSRRIEAAPASSWSHRGRVVFPLVLGYGTGLPLSPGLGLMATGPSFGLVSLRSTTTRNGGADAQTTNIRFHPAADVFVTDHLTVGGELVAARSLGDVDAYSILARPRVGWSFDLGPIAIWSRLAMGYGVARSEVLPQRSLTRWFSAQGTVDAVLPLTRYALLSIGPALGFQSGTSRGAADVDHIELGMNAFLGLTLP